MPIRYLLLFSNILCTLSCISLGGSASDNSSQNAVLSEPTLRIERSVDLLSTSLAAESYRNRNEAKAKLISLGPSALQLLMKYSNHAEPEIRNGIEEVIQGICESHSVKIPDIDMNLMLIRPGAFLMGEDKGNPNERPARKVLLPKPFWMGQTEVTQGQYKSVIGKYHRDIKNENLPVQGISWHGAVEFCKKLTEKEHKMGRLHASLVYRLPTEAEWEYCCRSGEKGSFCFGDDSTKLGDYAWYSDNSDRKPHPVGKKRPNLWGLYDMHGNVWEWCYDWYGKYPSNAQTAPLGHSTGKLKVFRGGNYFHGKDSCRSVSRLTDPPTEPNRFCGFRVVISEPIARGTW